MNANPIDLVEKMNVCSDAILINQASKHNYEELHKGEHCIKAYTFKEKGVGLSRNSALLRADHTYFLFSDEDIVYCDNYERLLKEEYKKHPEADMILFNFDVCEERRTYYNTEWKRIHWYNCGRYPTFSFSGITEKVHKKNVSFSLLFGGGAKYSNGEDSLFLRDCLKRGLKIYASPICLGKEIERPSTWFSGYHEKFFRDRGVLYYHLYGSLSKIFALRFLWKHQEKICNEVSRKQAYEWMKAGIVEAKR